MNKLLFKDLQVSVDNKCIISKLNFSLVEGDVIAVLGPNGVGKSTFLKSIMNHYLTTTNKDSIMFNGECINDLDTSDIAKKGFYFLDQNIVELDGIKLFDVMRIIAANSADKKSDIYSLYKKLTPLFNKYGLDQDMLNRFANVNFSGGQRKKSEMIQLSLFDSKVILLDEVDSGVDIDTINLIAHEINSIKAKNITLIVSHQEHLLEKIKPNKCMVILGKDNIVFGDNKMIGKILSDGYKSFDIKKDEIFDKLDDFGNEFK